MKRQSRSFVWVVVGVAVLAAGSAVAGETPGEESAEAALSAVSIARIEVGVEARLLDAAVSEVQLDVFNLETDALVWTSGRLGGSAVVWPTDGTAGDRFRFSVKGWDRQGVLVTHQVTVKSLAPIVDITFDNIAAGTDFMPGPGEIDLDGDVIINATGYPGLEIESGTTTGTVLRLDAADHAATWDALEIDMGAGGAATANAIEVQRGTGGVSPPPRSTLTARRGSRTRAVRCPRSCRSRSGSSLRAARSTAVQGTSARRGTMSRKNMRSPSTA